jgi:hypothetical protein
MRFCMMFVEGSGLPDESVMNIPATQIGTPIWGNGPLGPMLGGFTTSNYIDFTPTITLGVFPFWIAAQVVNSDSTTVGNALGISDPATTNTFAVLQFNGASNRIVYSLRDDAGTAAATASFVSATVSDGTPHVIMGVSWSASDHRLYWDGVQVGTVATALGTFSPKLISLGVLHRTTIAQPFPGSLTWAAIGSGAIPDPMVMATAIQSGRYPVTSPLGWLVTPKLTSVGTGAAALVALVASGAGTFMAPSSGAAALSALVAAGTGSFTATSSGATSLSSLVTAGTGTFKATGTGAAALSSLVATGTGTFKATGTGAAALSALVAAGFGGSGVFGVGAAALSSLVATGTGTFKATGTGAAALVTLVAAGAGTFTAIGLGSAVLASLSAIGAGVSTGGGQLPWIAWPDPFASQAIPSGDPFRSADPFASQAISTTDFAGADAQKAQLL